MLGSLLVAPLSLGIFGGVGLAETMTLAHQIGVQVLAVTHAPQVAARAGAHFLVAKQAAKGGKAVVTTLAPLDAPKRREEIARMLAGAVVTEEARAAAERLIRGAA